MLKVIEYAVGLEGDPLQNCYKWQLINIMCRPYHKPKKDNEWKVFAAVGFAIALYFLITYLTK